MNIKIFMDWFTDAKLGIFIHWGIYSVPAYDDIDSAKKRSVGNGSEWYLERLTKTSKDDNSYKLTKEYHKKNYGNKKYHDFQHMFIGTNFNADEWCKFIKDIGAKYLVFTAKHHDGFCMWNTATTYFNVINTPLGRDVLLELRNAATKYNLKFGIYFSWMEFEKNITPEFMDTIVKPQLEELTMYNPDLWWFDGDWVAHADILESATFVKIAREMGAIVNSRLGKKSTGGDYHNFSDRFIPAVKLDKVFEACHTIGLSWGYNKQQITENYKTAQQLFELYNNITSRNGNLLLNIAPDNNGFFDKIEKERLIELSILLKLSA